MFQHQIFLISYLGMRSVSLALSKKLGQRPKYCLEIKKKRERRLDIKLSRLATDDEDCSFTPQDFR
jgi:hypothetical protein